MMVKIMGELTKLPGVGRETEQDLIALGYKTIKSLIGADPEKMYEAECRIKGITVDRCQLYVYRCAVYCAEMGLNKSSGVKWWNFKDK